MLFEHMLHVKGCYIFFFLISNETYIHHENKCKIAIIGVHDGEHKKQRNKATKKRKREET